MCKARECIHRIVGESGILTLIQHPEFTHVGLVRGTVLVYVVTNEAQAVPKVKLKASILSDKLARGERTARSLALPPESKAESLRPQQWLKKFHALLQDVFRTSQETLLQTTPDHQSNRKECLVGSVRARWNCFPPSHNEGGGTRKDKSSAKIRTVREMREECPSCVRVNGTGKSRSLTRPQKPRAVRDDNGYPGRRRGVALRLLLFGFGRGRGGDDRGRVFLLEDAGGGGDAVAFVEAQQTDALR